MTPENVLHIFIKIKWFIAVFFAKFYDKFLLIGLLSQTVVQNNW